MHACMHGLRCKINEKLNNSTYVAAAAADGEEDVAVAVHEEGVAAPVVRVVIDAEHDAAVGVIVHRVAVAVEQQRLAPHRKPLHHRRR